MKKTVGKGILFYLFVLLSIVCGVLCIFAGILIFSPGAEIFGLSYSHSKVETYYQKVADDNQNRFIGQLISESKIEKIIIESDNFDIYVNRENVVNVGFRVKNSYSGLSKHEQRKEAEVTNTFDKETRTYTIKVLGPECALWFSNASRVVLSLPDTFDMRNVDLEIKTNKSKVILGNTESYSYTFRNLSVTSENSSIIQLNSKISFTKDVKIISKNGEIRQLGTLDLNNFEIQTDNAKIVLNKIICSNELKLISESSAVKITEINGKMVYDAKSGVISINKITGEFSCSERVNISNIQIGEAYGYVLLPKANTSNITIDKLYARARIITSSGNVKINQAYSISYIETDSGKIEVTFNPDNSESQEFSGNLSTLKTNSGDIIANYNNVLLENEISTEKGNIVVNFNNDLEFNLSYSCGEKDPKLADGIPNKESLTRNESDIKIGNGSTVNKLIITNEEGILDIRNTFELSK